MVLFMHRRILQPELGFNRIEYVICHDDIADIGALHHIRDVLFGGTSREKLACLAQIGNVRVQPKRRQDFDTPRQASETGVWRTNKVCQMMSACSIFDMPENCSGVMGAERNVSAIR